MYIDPETLSNQSSGAVGLLALTAEQKAMYLQYHGRIRIVSTDPVVIEPNIEAWEAWKAEQLEPQPEAPNMVSQIQTAMMAFAATSNSIPDSYALGMPSLFPTWEDVLEAGNKLRGGTILNDGGQLYRVNHDDTLPLEHQPPHGEGMTDVYTPINNTNAGTAADPIPAVRGMEYTYGLIYKDPDDGQLYVCKRTGEADGGKITLQYLPHELIGQYFEVYTGE